MSPSGCRRPFTRAATCAPTPATSGWMQSRSWSGWIRRHRIHGRCLASGCSSRGRGSSSRALPRLWRGPFSLAGGGSPPPRRGASGGPAPLLSRPPHAVAEGLVGAWVVVGIFSRELLITILRSVGASEGRVIAAAPLGKTKTVTQMAAVTLLILQRPYPGLVPIAALAVAVAVIFTIGSGIDYLVRFRHLIGLGGRASGSSPVDPMADELGTMLIREQLTLSVAESCTGGLLGALITDRPGSSAYFLGGVIAYAHEVKPDELNVPAALLTRTWAVSLAVAIGMADGARARFASSLAVSTTGIAGPDSDSSRQPAR